MSQDRIGPRSARRGYAAKLDRDRQQGAHLRFRRRSIRTRYELRDGKPVIVRLPEIEYRISAPGPHLGLIVHHDDGEREYACDRQSSVGRLDRGLDEAATR